MSSDGAAARERAPRHGRYLIPRTTPKRAEVVAALGVVAAVAHLLFAQLTLVLAVAFFAITKVSRWRPQWLAVPAAAGGLWALSMGPAAAVRGLLTGPRQVLGYLGGVGADPARLLHLGAAFSGLGHWLPRQLPLALVAAAAEAAAAAWLSWLHTDSWQLAAPRPGALVALRRGYVTRAVRVGGVVTRDGGCLGIDVASGRRAAVSWDEAAAGLLCAGARGTGTTTTSFQLVHAAIRRRKPVIAVDLSGSQQLAEWFAIVCGATGTPLRVFSPAGPAYYEPLRGADPGTAASLVMGMIDWTGTPDQHRRSCGAYLNDLFAVTAAAPGDPRTPVLSDLLHLLNPAALRARAAHVPPYHPGRGALIDRVAVSTGLLQADPQPTAALTAQLNRLRIATLGRWLAPDPARAASQPAAAAHAAIDLGLAMRRREVVLFSLDQGACGTAAASLASLVAGDIVTICAELRRIGVPGDGVVWFDQCGGLRPALLTDLVAHGAGAGLATVLTTTSASAAAALADQVGTVLIHRMSDPVLAERFARLTGDKLVPGGPVTAATAPGSAVLASNGLASNGLASNGLVSNGLASAGLASAWPGVRPSSLPFGAAGRGGPAGGPPSWPTAGPVFVRRPVVSPEALCGLAKGRFVLVVKGAAGRLVTAGLTVPARLHVVSGRRAATAAARQAEISGAATVLAAARQPLSTGTRVGGSTPR
jgi:hypothetical protein